MASSTGISQECIGEESAPHPTADSFRVGRKSHEPLRRHHFGVATDDVDDAALGVDATSGQAGGAAKAVLMDVASYDKWRDTVALLQLIAQSEADLEAGRTVSQAEAFARAERAIAEVEQGD